MMNESTMEGMQDAINEALDDHPDYIRIEDIDWSWVIENLPDGDIWEICNYMAKRELRDKIEEDVRIDIAREETHATEGYE